jgi:hypothetical protein
MTKKYTEQSLRRYWAAKRGIAAYGLSEFEDEPNFATVPANSTSWAAKPIIILSDVYSQKASQDHLKIIQVTAGSGKTQTFLGYTLKQFQIAVRTPGASGGTVTLSTVSQSVSMATQETRISDDESVGEIIWRVATTLPVPYRTKLAVRLSELQNAMQEEDIHSGGITVASLHFFVEFLRSNPVLQCPALSVTPDGNIYASWKPAADRVFSIHFLPDAKVRFVIFRPNDKHLGDVIRLSGIATVDMLMSIAAPHGVLDWKADERSTDTRV